MRNKAPKIVDHYFLISYKEYYSLVLLAIVDANYKFIAIDVGSYDKEGNSCIFQKSIMGKKIARNQFNAPKPEKLPVSQIVISQFLIGDEAFALDV